MTDDAPPGTMTIVLAALAALGSLLFGNRAEAQTPPAPVVQATPVGEAVDFVLRVDGKRLGREVTVRQQRAMLAIAEKALGERLPKVEVARGTDAETGVPFLEVRAPESAGYTRERLQALATSTGELLFQAVLTKADLEGTGTSMDRERIRVDTWMRLNPDAPIGHFSRVPREKGGPFENVRWAWRPATPDGAEPELVPLLVEDEPKWRFGGEDFDSFRVTEDHRGSPAISFSVREDRRDEFGSFTAFHVDRQVAAVVGDRVLTTPMIASPLRAGGIISGGSFGFSDVEAADLVTVLSHPLPAVPLIVAPDLGK